jgi:excisionase family DNA binding protein
MLIDKKLLHVSDAASLLSCSSKVIYELIHENKLPAYKTGRAWKIPEESIKNYIACRLSKRD